MKKKETQEALDRLKKIEADIRRLKKEAESIKASCRHQDYQVRLVETLAYAMTPMRVCVVCGRHLGDPTRGEKEAVWREFYDCMEMELTGERLRKIIDGTNGTH